MIIQAGPVPAGGTRQLTATCPYGKQPVYSVDGLFYGVAAFIWTEIPGAVLFSIPGQQYPGIVLLHGKPYIFINLFILKKYIVFGPMTFYQIALQD
jgi:hypothetical protein